jgi:SAM-dependent methyltransferase
MIVRALELGFSNVSARGFDISHSQIEEAQSASSDLTNNSAVHLTFDVADLTKVLPEENGTMDLTLCLYSVLSHLPVRILPDVALELARVTSGHLVVAVRSVGSVPSGFVYPIEAIRYLRHDHDRNQCEIELQDRSRATFPLHLFTAAELRTFFAQHLLVEDVRGLDLFYTRFAPDIRWSPSHLRDDKRLCDQLAELEESYATRPDFVDRATHIMLVAKSLSATTNDAT